MKHSAKNQVFGNRQVKKGRLRFNLNLDRVRGLFCRADRIVKEKNSE